MFTSALLLLALASAEPHTVLVLDLNASGIDGAQSTVLNDIVGQSVTRHPELKVITSSDVRRMADVDATKSLIGCDDESCLAELAGDFGAQYVLYGSVAQLGEVYVIQLTLFDAEGAEAVKRTRIETRDLSSVTTKIDVVVDEVFEPLLGPSEGDEALPMPAIVTTFGAVLTVAGVIVMVVGVQPALAYDEAQRKIKSEQEAFEGGDADALVRARDHQSTAASSSAAWDEFGTGTTTGGVVLALVGAGVTTAGALWWAGVFGE